MNDLWEADNTVVERRVLGQHRGPDNSTGRWGVRAGQHDHRRSDGDPAGAENQVVVWRRHLGSRCRI
jgi:hypothetical protein